MKRTNSISQFDTNKRIKQIYNNLHDESINDLEDYQVCLNNVLKTKRLQALKNLPPELLDIITSYLTPVGRFQRSFLMMCKEWYDHVLSNERYWKAIWDLLEFSIPYDHSKYKVYLRERLNHYFATRKMFDASPTRRFAIPIIAECSSDDYDSNRLFPFPKWQDVVYLIGHSTPTIRYDSGIRIVEGELAYFPNYKPVHCTFKFRNSRDAFVMYCCKDGSTTRVSCRNIAELKSVAKLLELSEQNIKSLIKNQGYLTFSLEKEKPEEEKAKLFKKWFTNVLLEDLFVFNSKY